MSVSVMIRFRYSWTWSVVCGPPIFRRTIPVLGGTPVDRLFRKHNLDMFDNVLEVSPVIRVIIFSEENILNTYDKQ